MKKSSLSPAANPSVAVTTSISPSQLQLQTFEQGMKLFHARSFAEAITMFQSAASGPVREIAHAARQHQRMCEQRLAQAQPELQSPEDLYHYAVSLLNQKRPQDAERHLRQALQVQPEGEHLHYTLAICRGLAGDYPDAARHLEYAIRLEPKNRGIARTDPDVLQFARNSPVRELLFAEKKDPD